jgi:hypothetical protein
MSCKGGGQFVVFYNWPSATWKPVLTCDCYDAAAAADLYLAIFRISIFPHRFLHTCKKRLEPGKTSTAIPVLGLKTPVTI